MTPVKRPKKTVSFTFSSSPTVSSDIIKKTGNSQLLIFIPKSEIIRKINRMVSTYIFDITAIKFFIPIKKNGPFSEFVPTGTIFRILNRLTIFVPSIF